MKKMVEAKEKAFGFGQKGILPDFNFQVRLWQRNKDPEGMNRRDMLTG